MFSPHFLRFTQRPPLWISLALIVALLPVVATQDIANNATVRLCYDIDPFYWNDIFAMGPWLERGQCIRSTKNNRYRTLMTYLTDLNELHKSMNG
jgi:hypothetical protein